MASSSPSAAATAVVSTPDLPPVSQTKMLMDTGVFVLVMVAIFYFILIRPQHKKFKDHQAMLTTLEKGDKVVVAGGIIGTVFKFEGDDVVVVEIAENTRIKIARSAVNESLKALPASPQKPAKAANDK